MKTRAAQGSNPLTFQHLYRLCERGVSDDIWRRHERIGPALPQVYTSRDKEEDGESYRSAFVRGVEP